MVREDAEGVAEEVNARATGHAAGEPPDDADVAVEVVAMPRPEEKPYLTARGKNAEVRNAIGNATAPGYRRSQMAAVYVGDALASLPARFGNLKGAQARNLVAEIKAKGAEARVVVITGEVVISRPPLDVPSRWATLVMDAGDVTHAVPEEIYRLAKAWAAVGGRRGPLKRDEVAQVLNFAWNEAGNLLDRFGYTVVWGRGGYDERGKGGYDIVRTSDAPVRSAK